MKNTPALLLAAVSAVSAVPNCTFPKRAFFGKVDTFLYGPGPGSLDLWNASIFWAHGRDTAQERIDLTYHDRALSSGPMFIGPRSDQRIITGGNTYTVDEKGTCTSQPASTFLNTACVGSIARFLPVLIAGDSDWSKAQPDEFMGYDTVEGVKCAVFGWNETCAPGIVDRTHRVYVSLDTQQPVLEVMGVRLGCSSYPAHAYVRFSELEDQADSFLYLQKIGGLFDVPQSCNKTASPPSTMAATRAAVPESGCTNTPFAQCGGVNFEGPVCCPTGLTCQRHSPAFSQCLAPGANDAKWEMLF